MIRNHLHIFAIFLCVFLGAFSYKAQAQGEAQPIPLSGLIISNDNVEPISGAHLYIPRAGRGSVSNSYGYFDLSVLPNDTVVISAIGYKTHYYKVPSTKKEGYTVVIELANDTTMLPVVEIFPYPTEELFKEAFLALKLPEDKNIERMRENLNQKILTRMAFEMGMDGNMNYRNYMNQQMNMSYNKNFLPTLQLLNPFAWAQFIKSIKRGDLKKKSWQED